MNTGQLVGLGILALGILLLNRSRKRKPQNVFNRIVINPMAIFIYKKSHSLCDFSEESRKIFEQEWLKKSSD
jgi:hypothetical protein